MNVAELIYLLQVDVSLHYLSHSMLGQGSIFLEKLRQRFIIMEEVLQFET